MRPIFCVCEVSRAVDDVEWRGLVHEQREDEPESDERFHLDLLKVLDGRFDSRVDLSASTMLRFLFSSSLYSIGHRHAGPSPVGPSAASSHVRQR